MIETFWKPCGMTSNDFADHMKAQLQTKKLCYAGRLDPLAQGVMLILTDEDVKEMNQHLTHNKVYKFQMVLGVSTQSHDIAGAITGVQGVHASEMHTQHIINELERFVPMYDHQQDPAVSSFVVRQGHIKKPLWWYDKHNIVIDTIPSKPVKIFTHTIENVAYVTAEELCHIAFQRLQTIQNEKTKADLHINDIMQQYANVATSELRHTNLCIVTMTLDVSTGFYIRKFCEDFGKHIGVPSSTFDITRLSIYSRQF